MFFRCNCLLVIIAGVLSCSKVVAEQNSESPAKTPEQAAKSFVDTLDQGDFAGAAKSFDAAMLKAMPADELKKTWEKLLTQAGAYKGQLGARRESSDKYEIAYVTCEFEKAKIDARVVFDKDGKITGLFFGPSRKPTPSGAEETWDGVLKAGTTDLRLVFHLFKQKDGTYTGTMDSLDQGATGIPLDEVSVKSDSVRLGLKSAAVVFEGKRDKEKITGQFKQAGQSFPLTLTKSANTTKASRSPTPPAKP